MIRDDNRRAMLFDMDSARFVCASAMAATAAKRQ